MSRTFVLAAAVLLGVSAPAAAHDLRAKLDPDATDPLRVEAWFDDDTPAQQARVSVVRSTGETVASGFTDERGLWSFPRPGPGLYRITVESTGHRDTLRFTVPGAEEPTATPSVEEDTRLDKNLGLIIGLALLLGGSLAFILLRRRKRTTEPAS